MIKEMTKEERQENFEFLMEDFINSYKIYHTKEETVYLVKKMLIQKHIAILPECLKVYGRRGVSYHLRKAIEKRKDSNEYSKYHLERFDEEIKYSHFLENEYRNSRKNDKFKLKRIFLRGTITTISLASSLHFSSIVKGDSIITSRVNEIKYEDNSLLKTKEDTRISVVEIIESEEKDNIITNNKIRKLEEYKLSKKESEKKALIHKKKVLNNYKKCKTIREIKLRQEELENLKLTNKDKIYKDCPLSPAIQQFIYEQSIINDIPVDLTFSIIYTETRGEFDSSGEKYYNSSTNYDLGLTQQNSVYRVPPFAEKYGLQKEDACDLVQYNDYINICCAFLEYNEINGQLETFNPYEFAGLYNGWTGWRENEISQEYVKIFTDAYDNIYTDHHEVEKSKILNKSKRNK